MPKKSDIPVALFRPFTAEELADAHARGHDAASVQKETFHKIGEICRSFNQIELLSRLAMVAIAEQSTFGSPNFNPSLQQFELEVFQAVALSEDLKEGWSQSEISLAVEKAIALLRSNSTAFKNASLLKISGDIDKDKIAAVIDRIRITTLSVRGARHAFQTRAYLRDLAKSLDGKFQEQLGFTVSDVIFLFESTAFRIDQELESLRSKSRRWMMSGDPVKCLALFCEDNPEQAYHPLLLSVSSKVTGLSEMKGTLFAIFEEKLRYVFRIDKDELRETPNGPKLWDALENISLGFGDISHDMIEHLHLSNPIVTKPLVSDGSGNYYLFCGQTMFANMIEIFEILGSKLNQPLENLRAH